MVDRHADPALPDTRRNNVYTIVYTAWDDTRFHPIGMVKVKLNPEVLDKLTAELKPAIPYLNEVGAQAMPRNIVPIKNPYFNMPQLKRPVFLISSSI